MNRGTHVLLGALLVTTALAGCLGDDAAPAGDDVGTDTERALSVSERGASSERAEASVATVTGDITYDDLVVTVNGDPYQFAADASFRDATYTANGVSDADTPVQDGHVLRIPATGNVELGFRDGSTGAVWDTYQTDVPDDDAPSAPTLQAPANGASGVSRNPTFQWAPVADPSGVSYSLQISLDESFSQDAVVQEYDDISNAQFQMSQSDQLQPGLTYYWHVRGTDGADNTGSWSPTWSFTTEPR